MGKRFVAAYKIIIRAVEPRAAMLRSKSVRIARLKLTVAMTYLSLRLMCDIVLP
jgi:hypothetical protein